MEQKFRNGCSRALQATDGGPVVIQGGRLVTQTESCIKKHGPRCFADAVEVKELAPRLWVERHWEGASDATEFTFTQDSVMLASTSVLNTEYGALRCLPDAEYALWRNAGFCQVSPLVLRLDDVLWRVIATENAIATTKTDLKLPKDVMPALELYLRAHHEGGVLLDEVNEATARGEKDLQDHREFLFKVFSIVSMPPTLSHDLSKTKLVNFALGRCFSSNDLPVLQGAVTFEDCMSLVRKLHLEVENHHPEHGARPALSLLDMYLDRVSRGIQKTHGWSKAAWSIPERFAPAEYRLDFARLEQKYGHLELADPGELHLPTLLPGARLDVQWEDIASS